MGTLNVNASSDSSTTRHSTGIPALDDQLGGGLLPGTLTVVLGATGIGKSQLGLHYAHQGASQERLPGVILDLSARGDSQNHRDYAQRMFQWSIDQASDRLLDDIDHLISGSASVGDYLNVFTRRGLRMTRRDLADDEWNQWQGELNRKLNLVIGFLYGSLTSGRRRLVVDGFEPTDRPGESIQFDVFEYVYHQVLRKESDWVARDLLREKFLGLRDVVEATRYDHQDLSCVALCTSHDSMLDDLITRPLDEGDTLANANTLIYMGKVRDGMKMKRALYIAKHRGSACSDEILPFEIGDDGITLLS